MCVGAPRPSCFFIGTTRSWVDPAGPNRVQNQPVRGSSLSVILCCQAFPETHARQGGATRKFPAA